MMWSRAIVATAAVAATVTGCASSGQPAGATSTPKQVATTTQSPTPVDKPTTPASTPASASGTIPADFQGQPARPCVDARPGQEISFRIEPDTPQPSCWKTREFSSVRIVNATGDFHQQPRVVTGSLAGVGSFRLEPGTSTVLRLPAGKQFATGDHCVNISVYPGSCLAIWLAP